MLTQTFSLFDSGWLLISLEYTISLEPYAHIRSYWQCHIYVTSLLFMYKKCCKQEQLLLVYGLFIENIMVALHAFPWNWMFGFYESKFRVSKVAFLSLPLRCCFRAVRNMLMQNYNPNQLYFWVNIHLWLLSKVWCILPPSKYFHIGLNLVILISNQW